MKQTVSLPTLVQVYRPESFAVASRICSTSCSITVRLLVPRELPSLVQVMVPVAGRGQLSFSTSPGCTEHKVGLEIWYLFDASAERVGGGEGRWRRGGREEGKGQVGKGCTRRRKVRWERKKTSHSLGTKITTSPPMDALKLTYAGKAIQERKKAPKLFATPTFHYRKKKNQYFSKNRAPWKEGEECYSVIKCCSVIGVYRFRACSKSRSSMCSGKKKIKYNQHFTSRRELDTPPTLPCCATGNPPLQTPIRFLAPMPSSQCVGGEQEQRRQISAA